MNKILTVFCDKGGVGKTTITLMLAHGFAAIHGKNVLALDLDETPRLSEAVMGRGNFLNDVADGMRISSLIHHIMFKQQVNAPYFIRPREGALKLASGAKAPLAIIPGDHALSKNESLSIGHMLRGNHAPSIARAQQLASEAVQKMVENLAHDFDYILIDAPPRITHFSRGAMDASDMVIVPYVPGSGAGNILIETGVKIEKVKTGDELRRISFAERKYVALPNMTKKAKIYGHANMIDDLRGEHPHLRIEVQSKLQLSKLIEAPSGLTLSTMKERYRAPILKIIKDLCVTIDSYTYQKSMKESVA